MDLMQLVYASRPFGYDDATLNGILFKARENNARDQISGALICRADIFLQLLEGPPAAVEAAFDRIQHDDRHVEVTPLVRRPVSRRLFEGWAMRDDEARSWMWTREEVDDGAVFRASESDVIGIFERLAAEGQVPAAAPA